MKSVQEALTEILAAFSILPTETIPLADGLGRTLAAEVHATDDLPPFNNSSMDGYAVQAADTAQTPVVLRVIADIPAGVYPTERVEAGTAARIMTGAMLPEGADAVIPVESTDSAAGDVPLPPQVEIQRSVHAGDYVRLRGEDVRAGEHVFSAGHVLRPQDLGLLAGLGVAQVSVRRRPRVAILSTGDELLPPDAPLTPGKIRDMNSLSLRAMVMVLGGEVLSLGTAKDTAESVRERLLQGVEGGADVILSSAGVSVGTHDVVKDVLESLGAVGFWRVNMRPGKPLAFGHVRGVPFLGLPGNPVSALATFEVFVRPILLKLLGQSPQPNQLEAIAGEDIPNDGRESYIRVILRREDGRLVAYQTGTQSSGVLSSLVKADGLLIVPAGTDQLAKGQSAWVRPFAGQPILK